MIHLFIILCSTFFGLFGYARENVHDEENSSYQENSLEEQGPAYMMPMGGQGGRGFGGKQSGFGGGQPSFRGGQPGFGGGPSSFGGGGAQDLPLRWFGPDPDKGSYDWRPWGRRFHGAMRYLFPSITPRYPGMWWVGGY